MKSAEPRAPLAWRTGPAVVQGCHRCPDIYQYTAGHAYTFYTYWIGINYNLLGCHFQGLNRYIEQVGYRTES